MNGKEIELCKNLPEGKLFFSNKFSIFIVERLSSVVMLRTGKEIRFRFGSSEDKAGKEAQHQKRSAQRSAFLVLG